MTQKSPSHGLLDRATLIKQGAEAVSLLQVEFHITRMSDRSADCTAESLCVGLPLSPTINILAFLLIERGCFHFDLYTLYE